MDFVYRAVEQEMKAEAEEKFTKKASKRKTELVKSESCPQLS